MARYITDIKNKYIENLSAYNLTDRMQELLSKDAENKPIYKPLIAHEDEESKVKEHNTMLYEMCLDINGLNSDLSATAVEYYDLINQYTGTFEDIYNKLKQALEMQTDINMLCKAYSNFNNIIDIDTSTFDGIKQNSVTNNLLHLNCNTLSESKLSVSNITGNGYTGNKYVYDSENKKYLNETIKTADPNYITDNVANQYFEYSRLVSSDISNSGLCTDVNNDTNNARCTVYIQSDSVFNILYVSSNQKNLKIIDLYYSLDGAAYIEVPDFHNFDFNNSDNQYTINNYILNSGIFNIPDAKYVKITFESNDYNVNETLACQVKSINSAKVSETTTVLNNTQRYTIKINAIKAFRNVYEKTNTIISKDILSSSNYNKINSIAIFDNEYIPNLSLSEENEYSDYIKYYLIINDTEYEIIPINRNIDNRNDTKKKIIRIADGLSASNYVEYISEDIKNVKLKIVLNRINEYNSPYLSNLKLLVSESSGV